MEPVDVSQGIVKISSVLVLKGAGGVQRNVNVGLPAAVLSKLNLSRASPCRKPVGRESSDYAMNVAQIGTAPVWLTVELVVLGKIVF